ncbi:hypothetical protein DSM112329_02480 [Paraconexibacter sp. AEG42_29]|uniref:Spore-associated protein A n=1 Tax=Paraconexibacter sp. AEG42_29 TaxID=2997339 RepID=A0AAU7AVJ2_9ACTN
MPCTRRTPVLALTVAAATLGLAAGPASAAKNPYSPGQVCGAGYGVIDQRVVRTAGGTALGTGYLLYSGATKKNCAVVLKSKAVGKPSYTAVSLKKSGARSPFVVDFGDYQYYAGPVYVKAPRQCVKFGASIKLPDKRHGVFVTPFGHCS